MRLATIFCSALVAVVQCVAAEPRVTRCELAVIGGGSGGFGAALAAARLGVDVVLVERSDCLGGNSVRGGVSVWEPGVGGMGIPFDVYQRLAKIPQAVGIYSFGRHAMWYDPKREAYRYPGGETVIDSSRDYRDTLQRHGVPHKQLHGVVFEPEAMARTMAEMLAETGKCRVLLQTAFVSAETEAGRIKSVQLSNGDQLVADYFVDATGDGNVCAAVGCEMMSGQEARDRFGELGAPTNATSRINGVTLIYRVTPMTTPAVEPLPEDAPATKSFPAAQINQYPNGDLNVNMLPTMDGAEFMRRGYTNALAECHRRVRAHWQGLQTRCTEFRGYCLSWLAPALGIRETRRVVGEYVLTENDLRAGINGQKHPDIICLADHPPDTHGGHSGGIHELREPYGVPYRCLIPKNQRNLLIACRAASFSSIAASSCRLSRTMMALGEAAGRAVALAKELKVDLPDVPAARLRHSVEQRGSEVVLRDHADDTMAVVLPQAGFNCARFAVGAVDFLVPPSDPSKGGAGFGWPILFPFPNRIANGEFTFAGKTYRVKEGKGHAIHGFVHTQPWRVTATGTDGGAWVTGVTDTESNPLLKERWPWSCRLTVTYRLAGQSLTMTAVAENLGTEPMPFGFGVHPYHPLPMTPAGTRARCWIQVPCRERLELTPDCIPTGKRLPATEWLEGRALGDTKLDDVFAGATGTACVLRDPDSKWEVAMQADDAFKYWVVYAPQRSVVCFEPYTCVTDAFNLYARGVADTGFAVLEPGKPWRGVVTMRVRRSTAKN